MAKRRLSKRYLLMFRWGLPCLVAVLGLSYVALRSSARTDPSAPAADGTISGLTSVLDWELPAEMVRISFVDATEESGINFQHFPSQRRSLLPEDMGSGLAWGDVSQ